MNTKKTVSLGAAMVGVAGFAAAYRAFRRDMDRAVARISESQVVQTAHGAVEYASVGKGFPLLIIHGAGGGFDQLRSFDSDFRLSELGFRLIFVSRFGYLRTPLPTDASTRAQADAYAGLLDAVGIGQAGVIAVSAGAPSRLEFAARYSQRCAALVLLVPAAFVPGLAATEPGVPPLMQLFRETLLKSDFAFWAAIKLARGALIENILATPLEVANRASEPERIRTDKVLMDILPVSRRAAGLLNEAEVVTHMQPAEVGRIRCPTLLVSTEDDLYGTARSARYLAGQIPGARLVVYPDGGHLWLGHEAELQRELTEFLRPVGATVSQSASLPA